MAAKGTDSKNIVLEKLKEVFPEAFMDDKVLRIPLMEAGEEVQIKVALTCAKDNLPHAGGAEIIPSITINNSLTYPNSSIIAKGFTNGETHQSIELSEEEKAKVAQYLQALAF